MTWIAIFALAVVLYTVVSRRLGSASVSAPIIFMALGAVVGLLRIPPELEPGTVLTIAEVTLALILFHDAAQVRPRDFVGDRGPLLRLLLIGLPLTIALGWLAATAVFPGAGVWVALLVAAALAPTDAGLGAPTVLNPVVPGRVRRLLNGESGLNDGLATPVVLFALAATITPPEQGDIRQALLAAALEVAKAGDTILVAAYGDGADALALRVEAPISGLADRRGVRWHLERRGEMPNYDMFIRFRQLLPTENDRRAGAGISATKHFRDRDYEISLHAQKCRKCGQVQYPHQRVCFKCHARDEFDHVRLSDRIGTLKSFTFDNFAGSPNPPLVATVTDVDGARLYLQMTDANPKEVRLDLPVELVFRKIHDAGGTPNYFWKCTPVRDAREERTR